MHGEPPAKVPLAIIGGGAAAAWLLIMLRRLRGALPATVVIEPRATLGPGLAYSTALDSHRLNVTADKMDMHPVIGVDGFVDWLAAASGYGADDHVPRRLYAHYLERLVASELAGEPMAHRQNRVVAVSRCAEGFGLTFANGEELTAGRVVLAIGNPSSPPLCIDRAERVVEEPFGALPELSWPPERVLVVGAGLTAIDAILKLDHRWPRCTFSVVAPHPFFPPADKIVEPVAFEPAQPYPGPAGLWFWAKSHRSRAPFPESWFSPIDGLRPHAAAIWQAWRPRERAIFLRYAARYWLHLRHRTAPQAALRIAQLQESGRLSWRRGRAVVRRADERSVVVAFGGLEQRFDLVINATGPDLDPRNERLLASLLDADLVSPDPLGLGIRVDKDCTVLATSGQRVEGLHALGVWTRGSLWEVVAVPHLREAIRSMLAPHPWP